MANLHKKAIFSLIRSKIRRDFPKVRPLLSHHFNVFNAVFVVGFANFNKSK